MIPPDASQRHELLIPGPAEALAHLLDISAPQRELPPIWHWVYLLEHPRQRELGADGHPRAGLASAPQPGMRRMFAGGRVTTRRLLEFGSAATRTDTVVATAERQGRSGPLTFVTVRTEYTQGERVAIVEERDIVYRAAQGDIVTGAVAAACDPAGPSIEVEVDEAFLFRFSALTYNAHRIHYDLPFAQREGYPGLVVHGPLQALLMAELSRRSGAGLLGRTFTYRLLAPMIGTGLVRAQVDGEEQKLRVLAPNGVLTAVGTLTPA